jgi:hypothetical protein
VQPSSDFLELQEHIDKSLELLRTHYSTKYVATVATVLILQARSREVHNRSQSPRKHDFTARYKKSTSHTSARELEKLLGWKVLIGMVVTLSNGGLLIRFDSLLYLLLPEISLQSQVS